MALFGGSRTGDAALAARYKHLLTVAKALTSERDFKRVLAVVMDTIVELTGAERAFVWLGGAEEGRVEVARNFEKENVRKPASKISRSILKQAIDKGEPILTDNASADATFMDSVSIPEMKLRSVLCAPLVLHGKTLGAIYVDHRFQDATFGDEEQALLAEFSGLAAVAIENAQLFSENERQRKRLEELNGRLSREVATQNEEMEAYRQRLRSLKPRDRYKFSYSEVIGNSPAIREVFSILDRVIPTDFPVLLEGESGTGKELIARALHYNGKRSSRGFLTVNCAALTESLLESELFGHVKGSFTGADRTRDGLFQRAHGGTLFLDEIGEMSPSMQTKLLRALQDGEVRKVGSTRVDRVDVRIVSATNSELRKGIKDGTFREDLFYRINVVNIRVPPLRERREDVETLLDHFLTLTCREAGVERKLSAGALRILVAYDWPGNVRELQNEVKRMVALSDDVVRPELLERLRTRGARAGPRSGNGLGGRGLKDIERQAIQETLKVTGGNKAEAAKQLGISRRALYDKLEKYGLK
ncbi:MAG: sigma 54-interacting transcriptional regulator [Planctomycetota bacterium]|nr:sigma 54-interacting transcriptional regulator [Planctomycetota bacterium]